MEELTRIGHKDTLVCVMRFGVVLIVIRIDDYGGIVD
jgi:hypothetical protein